MNRQTILVASVTLLAAAWPTNGYSDAPIESSLMYSLCLDQEKSPQIASYWSYGVRYHKAPPPTEQAQSFQQCLYLCDEVKTCKWIWGTRKFSVNRQSIQCFLTDNIKHSNGIAYARVSSDDARITNAEREQYQAEKRDFWVGAYNPAQGSAKWYHGYTLHSNVTQAMLQEMKAAEIHLTRPPTTEPPPTLADLSKCQQYCELYGYCQGFSVKHRMFGSKSYYQCVYLWPKWMRDLVSESERDQYADKNTSKSRNIYVAEKLSPGEQASCKSSELYYCEEHGSAIEEEGKYYERSWCPGDWGCCGGLYGARKRAGQTWQSVWQNRQRPID